MEQIAQTTRYEQAASWWQDRMATLGYVAAYRAFFNHVLGPRSVGRLVDIGTGCGDFALCCLDTASAAQSITLVDPSKNMLRQAAARISAPVARAQSTLAEFECSAGFDTVLAAHVIEHTPDPVAAMAQLAKLLRPGGHLYVVGSRPHWCQWLIWLRWRHAWFPPEDVTTWAKMAGLEVCAVYAFANGPPARTSLGYHFRRPN